MCCIDHALTTLVRTDSSKQDEAHFAEMGLEFVDTQEGLALSDLQDLFLKVGGQLPGWSAPCGPVAHSEATCLIGPPMACSQRAPSLSFSCSCPPAGGHVRPPLLLLLQVGFAKRDPLRLKVAIENTYHLIWIRATKPVSGDPA